MVDFREGGVGRGGGLLSNTVVISNSTFELLFCVRSNSNKNRSQQKCPGFEN